MKFGFIGFGEVSYNLSKILIDLGFEVLTCVEERSEKTKELANSLDISLFDSYEELSKASDILISANSPQNSLGIAKKYALLTEGIFLDLNNVSPDTTNQISNLLSEDHFIDSVIIGKASSQKMNIYLSGKMANKLVKSLNDLNPEISQRINIAVVSDRIGDASRLKNLRSIYTKGVSALLIETFEIGEKLDLSDALWEILSLTENGDFEESSKSRIKNSYKSSKRKYEELAELLDFLNTVDVDDDSKIMTAATKNKFKSLENKK
ncbi:NAD(P)-binding domain-containing protein [uncultured Methanobrevibacter sp.]|uniref:NAD(P)-binding domain-containing protein n=1 Tax=uncultured Methanobrevibacter sp. TaxID=253161 RepID=UPI002630B7F9